jgi:demethylmenaquinone methyltransferase/2-methoxy-6-polyprenyl-1,4-benzoquinol methylase
MNSGEIKPYMNSSEEKKSQVARMFNKIAWRYDFLNHFLSLGIDKYWRKKAIRSLHHKKPLFILDIATGTGDLAIEAVSLMPEKIIGIDISTEMLEIGRKKILKKKLNDKIQLLEGDSEKLIFDDNKFDAITVAFGVRNFQNLEKGLLEINRVLKPGGTVVILEFSQPTNRFIKSIYDFYSSRITPGIGKMISKDKDAYAYLHDSVRAFPYGKSFTDILAKTGFRDIHYKALTFGVATIYMAEK